MIEFDRLSFFPLKKKINNSDLSSLLKSIIIDEKKKDSFLLCDLSSLENIRPNSLIFINDNIFVSDKMKKFHIITNNSELFTNPSLVNITLVNNLDRSYNLTLNAIFQHEDYPNFEDSFIQINNSSISKYALIEENVQIGQNCMIGRGVKIGKDCIIKNNVIIKNTIIEENVIIGDNSTIGSTGFGFNLSEMGTSHLLPQLGIVYIERNVRIGSGCSIDRGKIDVTFIGRNSMLDNQIHIAHNVIIGPYACLAAQNGIAGSTIIGSNVITGGQVGIAGHLKIGNNVKIAGKSGVTKNIKDNSTVAGFPAVDIKEWKKNIIKLKYDRYK